MCPAQVDATLAQVKAAGLPNDGNRAITKAVHLVQSAWFVLRRHQKDVPARFEQIARTLGATETRVFFTITLPLAFRGVVSGVLLAFARSLGDFVPGLPSGPRVQGACRALT